MNNVHDIYFRRHNLYVPKLTIRCAVLPGRWSINSIAFRVNQIKIGYNNNDERNIYSKNY